MTKGTDETEAVDEGPSTELEEEDEAIITQSLLLPSRRRKKAGALLALITLLGLLLVFRGRTQTPPPEPLAPVAPTLALEPLTAPPLALPAKKLFGGATLSRAREPSRTQDTGMRGPLAHAVNPTEFAHQVAADRKGGIQLCYEKLLKRNPALRGKVMVELDLQLPNRLSGVVVHDSFHSPDFTRCVQGLMQRMVVPPLTESVTVEIPFALSAPQF